MIGLFFDGCLMIIMEYCGGVFGLIWGGVFCVVSKVVVEKCELIVKEFVEML